MNVQYVSWSLTAILVIIIFYQQLQIRSLYRTISGVTPVVVAVREQLRDTSERLATALASNMAFQLSRDQAWDLYRRSSIGAGNAQAWLFRELQQAYLEINARREKEGEAAVSVPTSIEDMVSSFRQEHIEDARVKSNG